MHSETRTALTRIEVIVVLAIVVIAIALTVATIPRVGPQSVVAHESSQLFGIHQSLLIFARDFNGMFPVPGLIKRLPLDRSGIRRLIPPNRPGAPDISQNTTANLYSAVIMQNYFTPELCVGHTEPSDKVVIDEDYNWDVYDPLKNIHWDGSFKADLHGESNVSYAHLPLHGERVRRAWRETLSESLPVLSHRGPKDGNDPNTITFQILPPHDAWSGIVIYGDNSNGLNTDMLRRGIQLDIDGKLVPDHLFKFDEGPGGGDAILTFTKSMTAGGPECLWD